jgi:hypothetical protein
MVSTVPCLTGRVGAFRATFNLHRTKASEMRGSAEGCSDEYSLLECDAVSLLDIYKTVTRNIGSFLPLDYVVSRPSRQSSTANFLICNSFHAIGAQCHT